MFRINRRRLLRSSIALATLETVMCSPALARSLPLAARRKIPGLQAPIEIIDDHLGVPHIRAMSKADAFFGQGYVVARDHLFAIDLDYRRRTGRLAESFGAPFADHDEASHLLRYRGDLEAELAALGEETRSCLEAYVSGVNARIAECEADPGLLPLEYGILKLRPLHWDARQLMAGRDIAVGNLEEKIRRAALAHAGRLDLDAICAPLRPPAPFTPAQNLDLGAISSEDLGILHKAAKGLPFGTLVDEAGRRTDTANAGSNAWTLAGSHTASGRPILANDPHIGIGGFAPRHVAHLTAPGLDLIGAGAPGLPGIMQGHTDRFAFGRTNFHIDQEDVFILTLNPADPEQYRHNGGWRRFEKLDDTIAIAGAPPRQITLRASVHGPVTLHDPAHNRAVAIASVHLGKGGSTMGSMVAINLAQDWDSLIRAVAHHPPPTNLHYADTSGNTGWHAIGYAPERKSHNGLLPVPGDGAFDWQTIRAVKDMPSILNPKAGWFASANQDNVPEGYTGPMAHSFSAPFRYHRIEAVLPAKPRQTIADSVGLQHDIYSEPARRLLALLPAQAAGDAGLALAMLRGWDGAIAGDKGAPALYEMLVTSIQHHLLEVLVPEALRKLVPLVDSEALLTLLEQPDPRLGQDPAAVRATMLDQALGEAWQAARKALGDDPSAWRWDRLHKVAITHPLAAIPAIAKAFPPIDTAGTGGDTSTVMARWYRPGGSFHVAGGASYLMVVDVGGWDNSLFLNLPGQSADPRSPHRQDLYAPWIAGQMQPLLFSAEAVNKHASARTVLSAT